MNFAPFILLAILLGCSAILSGSETALFSLSKHQLYQCERSDYRLRRMVAQLMRRPRSVLLTILMGNTTVNVLIFANSVLLSDQLSQHSALLASLCGVATVILVIVIGEVLAKTVAISTAFAIAPWIAAIIKVLQIILAPVRLLLDGVLVAPITRLIVGGAEHAPKNLTLEELRTLVHLSDQQGIIGSSENDMLQEVVALSNIRIRSFMVPRVDMVAFDVQGQRTQLLELYRRRQLNKVPVYEQNVDQVLGVIYAKDVYLHPRQPLRRLVRRVNFVPEQMTADKLLDHFRDTRTQLAIVVDEYGGVSGLVSLEDVVEQIVGDIAGPEEDVRLVEQIGPRSFRMAGDLNIHEWYRFFGLTQRDSRIGTVGGLIAAHLGRVPNVGDGIQIGNVKLSVQHIRGRRVQWVQVELLGGNAA